MAPDTLSPDCPDGLDHAGLLASASQGDDDAWTVLWISLEDRVRGFLRNKCGAQIHSSVIDDLASEVAYRTFKGAAEYKGNSQVSTWVLGIAKNVWLEYDRKARTDEMTLRPCWRNMFAEAKKFVRPTRPVASKVLLYCWPLVSSWVPTMMRA